jgi:hypothetical protein
MHIDRADEVTMTHEAAGTARPGSSRIADEEAPDLVYNAEVDDGQVDFAQINGCLSVSRRLSRLRDLDADVQFKPPVPDQCACASFIPGCS